MALRSSAPIKPDQSELFSSKNAVGVGKPAACQIILVRHLSMANADAMTPLPVYGLSNHSSTP